MATFWRALRRRDVLRMAGAGLGVVWLSLVGAFAYAAISVQPSSTAIAAAVAALIVAAAGILYAWREPGR